MLVRIGRNAHEIYFQNKTFLIIHFFSVSLSCARCVVKMHHCRRIKHVLRFVLSEARNQCILPEKDEEPSKSAILTGTEMDDCKRASLKHKRNDSLKLNCIIAVKRGKQNCFFFYSTVRLICISLTRASLSKDK